MSIDLRLGQDTHDLTIRRYDLELVDGMGQVVQHVKQRLQLFRGEWFLDVNAGVPWLQEILRKNPRRAIVEQAMRAAIIGTPGIEELLNFELADEETRERTVRLTFRARTREGVVDETVEVGV